MIQPDMSSLEGNPGSAASAPESSEGASQVTETQNTGSNTQGSEIPELDKFERFKWEGKDWSLKDLKNSVLMQSDYSRKTEAISQERKYYDNLAADLDHVRSNPSMADKFREMYPEKFHAYLKYIQNESAQPGNAVPAQKPQMDPQLMSRIDQMEKMITEDKVSALEAKLEAQDQKMAAKFPRADIEAVYARASQLHASGTKLTDEAWEKLWQGDHDKHSKRFDSWQKETVQKQKEAISQSRDIGSGGGIPGQAPKKIKLKDVAESILSNS